MLDDVSAESDLAAGATQSTSMSITLPANLTNDTYYWLVWADGYDNVTESNNSNNNMWSTGVTVVGKDCSDLLGGTQNDGGLGADAAADPANATNMGSNVTTTYSGCMDGGDGDDVYAFDVPAGHYIEVSLTAQDSTSDLDLYLHDSNNTQVDRGFTASYPETASAKLTTWEGQAGTYYVNVTHYSGVSNYTLDVFTNVSIPAPDYVIEDVTGTASAQPGSSVVVFADLNNTGTLDGNSGVELIVILSEDLTPDWYDHEIGTVAVNGPAIGSVQSVTIPATIPADIVEGDYNLFVIVDQDDLVLERDKNNNQARRNGAYRR